MSSTVKNFYNFLKERYGKLGTEKIDPVDEIECLVEVEIPGLAKNIPKQNWTVHLENTYSAPDCKERRLILGTHWKSQNCYWSRYLQLEEQDHSSKPFFKLVETVPFEKEHNLQNLIAFIKVWEEFFETVEVEV